MQDLLSPVNFSCNLFCSSEGVARRENVSPGQVPPEFPVWAKTLLLAKFGGPRRVHFLLWALRGQPPPNSVVLFASVTNPPNEK